MALRVCRCGAQLEKVGPRVACPCCGVQAARWLVLLDGRPIAAGSTTEVFAAPALLQEGLGLTRAAVARAGRAGFAPLASEARRASR